MFQPRHLADGRICCSHEEALCATCKAEHLKAAATTAPPDGYALALAKLHGAPTPPPAPPKDATPPDGYALGLAALRKELR
jgi:hypothetical protein